MKEKSILERIADSVTQLGYWHPDRLKSALAEAELSANYEIRVQQLKEKSMALDNDRDINEQNPNHYRAGGIEPWDYIKAKFSPTQLAGFALGNVIKYVSRADHKNKVDDLKKAQWYLNKLIEEIESKNQDTAQAERKPHFGPWVIHNSSSRPPSLKAGTRVEVAFRLPNYQEKKAGDWEAFIWNHYAPGLHAGDIVAYRILGAE